VLVAIRMVGSGKQVYHSQRGELSLGRYEGWDGRIKQTLRKTEKQDGVGGRNVVNRNAAEMNGTRILRKKRNTMIQYNYKAIMLWLRPKRAQ